MHQINLNAFSVLFGKGKNEEKKGFEDKLPKQEDVGSLCFFYQKTHYVLNIFRYWYLNNQDKKCLFPFSAFFFSLNQDKTTRLEFIVKYFRGQAHLQTVDHFDRIVDIEKKSWQIFEFCSK